MQKKEIIVILVLSLLVALVWLFVPEIEVSGDTTIRQEAISPVHHMWNDGMGTTVHAYYVSPEIAKQDDRWAKWVDLAQQYTLFWVRMEMWEGPNFLMVDLDQERMTLHDDRDHEYRCLNEDVALATENKELRTLLTAFNLTMFNNAFPGGGSLALDEPVQEGIFLFEPLESGVETFYLHLHYSMSGQKARPIDFEFKR